jgi:hypothetical protein
MRVTFPANFIRLGLICLMIFGDQYCALCSSHCAASSILLSLHPSLVQIFSLGPCSKTPSINALLLL